MRNALIGIVAGLVIGVVLGVSVVAPRLKASLPETAAEVVKELAAGKSTPESPPGKPEPKPEAAPAETAAVSNSPEPAQGKQPESLLPPRVEQAPKVRWRMESAFASSLPQLGSQAKRIESEIWRVSAGEMEVVFHEPGSLVPERDMVNAVKAGAIDAAFIAPEAWPEDQPALQLFGAVPFGPRAEEYLAWLYFGGGEKHLNRIADDLDVRVLICGLVSPEGAGWYRQQVKTIEDLKGLRVRMTGLGARVLDHLGAKTVDLSEGDIFHALESGQIDAAEYSMPAIDQKLGLHKMASNYYFPGWHQPATLLSLVINTERWTPCPRSSARNSERFAVTMCATAWQRVKRCNTRPSSASPRKA